MAMISSEELKKRIATVKSFYQGVWHKEGFDNAKAEIVSVIDAMEKELCERKVYVGKRYRHFKGFEVEVIATATHTETNEKMVVYYCDSFDGKSHKKDENSVYVRPLDMFLSEVDHEKYPEEKQKYRFEEID